MIGAVKPSIMDEVNLREICGVARRTYQAGWNAGTAGNVSVRGVAAVFASRSGICKGQLRPRDFIAVELVSGKQDPTDYRKVSDETPLHLAIYRQVESARAIVHCHPPAVVAYTLRYQGNIQAQGHEIAKALGEAGHETCLDLPVIANDQDMQRCAAGLGKEPSLLERGVLILEGHGVYAWGPDPERALAKIEATELLCQTLWNQ